MPHNEFLKLLETGKLRAASLDADNNWVVDTSVKQRILDVIKSSPTAEMWDDKHQQYYGFVDKVLLKPRAFSINDKIRMVPGGSSVRTGAYIGQSVAIMPPSYINIGAYVDDVTMVDSHVLVGSCAQIGKRVHLSTAVQIGGVLEPIGNRPVIVEDDCFIGAGVILTEGIIVRSRAVLAPGVMLSAAVPIYDTVNQKVFKGEIPANAVVIPGSRPITSNPWAREQGISLNCAVIVKYRDAKTESSIELEWSLK